MPPSLHLPDNPPEPTRGDDRASAICESLTMPYLDLPTHRLHYRTDGGAGDKPWLTFCNSLGTDLHMWDDQIADLSGDFRILRYDRRGHGRSSAPKPPYGLADLGRDVIALLDALKIDRTHFCGLSIGGLTGQWLGIHAGERLGRIVVCATAARIGTAEGWNARIGDVTVNGLEGLVSATAERWFTPGFRAAHPGRVATILKGFAATSAHGYIGCCAALADTDLHGRLAEIANPLLAISGADDPVCPPACLEAIARSAQCGHHLTLPGRHVVNLESARGFNAALREFLTNDPDNAPF
ncbi:3-oxoadipate enol-lactonase [Paracoccus benzoatiresistens]|uniref:3-oxoadipate enol-lactonase n=1 Tax=Paracoccus benzoatiresistens TaxID=2997341 RepID=A0ABT4J465_9RHOB|nr:3-oxoadipate enol-lactonase [Paracoccus sp. EF6]MCZ0961888.1 3-oxoadipate enol-lactonase [Paracoccus sp. EF6]